VSYDCYGHMTHLLMALAGGKLLLCLEGGYSLKALPMCASSCLKALLGDPLPILKNMIPNNTAVRIVDRVIQTHMQYWKCFGPSTPSIDYQPNQGKVKQAGLIRPILLIYFLYIAGVSKISVGLKGLFYWCPLREFSFTRFIFRCV
jgi:hypothetical protein